jgi:hypothetical protein
MDNSMIEFPDYNIDEFVSFSDYQKFKNLVEFLVANSKVVEVNPLEDYDMYPKGRWFRRLDTDEFWRLLEPDYGFRGLWEQLDSKKLKGVY